MIKGIALDSRKVMDGCLFAAIKGESVDGHDFIDQAINAGASAILAEKAPDRDCSGITWIVSQNVRKDLGQIASKFYGNPSQKMKVIGVTGTNGKTTVASLLYSLFKELGYRVGLISTIEILINGRRVDTRLTTPDVVTLHSVFADMLNNGCDFVFMEVSSHAVVQERVSGVHFAAGVFTNLSHDHLDYHGTFAKYIEAKRRFFESLDADALAITNADDRNGEVMVQSTGAKVLKYSLRELVDYKGKLLSVDDYGMHIEINGVQVMSALVGRFNAYNLLAIYAIADLFASANRQEVFEALSRLRAVSGRMEVVSFSPKVIVDYAHTPDALENVLDAIKNSTKSGRIITVVGCGGDRDRKKRPLMAKAVTERSDQAIFTSDNPRSEDPARIIADMREGLNDELRSKVIEVIDRKMAIKTALAIADSHDTVLIAGKGHEQYQEINGERKFFSDQQIVKDILSKDI